MGFPETLFELFRITNYICNICICGLCPIKIGASCNLLTEGGKNLYAENWISLWVDSVVVFMSPNPMIRCPMAVFVPDAYFKSSRTRYG